MTCTQFREGKPERKTIQGLMDWFHFVDFTCQTWHKLQMKVDVLCT